MARQRALKRHEGSKIVKEGASARERGFARGWCPYAAGERRELWLSGFDTGVPDRQDVDVPRIDYYYGQRI